MINFFAFLAWDFLEFIVPLFLSSEAFDHDVLRILFLIQQRIFLDSHIPSIQSPVSSYTSVMPIHNTELGDNMRVTGICLQVFDGFPSSFLHDRYIKSDSLTYVQSGPGGGKRRIALPSI